MQLTWRWFGRKDPISLQMLRQIGIEGIVTSLYEISPGKIWPTEQIADLNDCIKSSGLVWSVVESLPVSEEIKRGGPLREEHIANYITSLENLGRLGIRTVCYNFMPVIDWIRTDLARERADGTTGLYFDAARFACFDIHILEREGARKDYTASVLERADALAKTITKAERDELIDSIIIKTQGFVCGNFDDDTINPVGAFRELLAQYEGIDTDALRSNLKYFLERIMPVCNEYAIRMCIHPDDPPFPVLGLPRICGNKEDIEWILNAVDDIHNGLTFCAGSLSAGAHNDVRELADLFADRTAFVHLRSTDCNPQTGDFWEESHLKGRGYLKEIIPIFETRQPQLPMRVDHGQCMLGDDKMPYNPGYSFHGRMHALGQVMGMMAMVKKD